MLADALAGADQWQEVRAMRLVHRGRYRNQHKIGLPENGRIGAVLGMHSSSHFIVGQFSGRILAVTATRDFVFGHIEADGSYLPSKFDNKRQANVTQADNSNRSHESPSDRKKIAQRLRVVPESRLVPNSTAKQIALCAMRVRASNFAPSLLLLKESNPVR